MSESLNEFRYRLEMFLDDDIMTKNASQDDVKNIIKISAQTLEHLRDETLVIMAMIESARINLTAIESVIKRFHDDPVYTVVDFELLKFKGKDIRVSVDKLEYLLNVYRMLMAMAKHFTSWEEELFHDFWPSRW